jgi:tRNA/tmRNA/rRNA uracil-C5-methylase (TrmA/RlmC/RlmD family)
VVVVANCDTSEPLAPAFELIGQRLGSDLHSLWFNANHTANNTILGPEFHRWCGPESVVERFGTAAVHYPPGAFGQNNLSVAERIVAHVSAQVPSGARVAEFYAGVGAIGLSLSSRLSELRMNEISPQSLRGLELGLAELDAPTRARCSVHVGAAGAAAAIARAADVVIVDPPRKGLDADLTASLSEHPPERLVYVSCALDSLLADTLRLTAPGNLRLTALHAFNLMPFTEHVETVACFERSAS